MAKFEKVVELINELYSDDNNNLLLTVLENDQTKHRSRENSSQWNALAALINKKQLFKHYADKIIAGSAKIQKVEIAQAKAEPKNEDKEKYKEVLKNIPKNYTDNAETLEMILRYLAAKPSECNVDNPAYLNILANLQKQTEALKQYEKGEIKMKDAVNGDDVEVFPNLLLTNPLNNTNGPENNTDIVGDVTIENTEEEEEEEVEEVEDNHSDYGSESDSDNDSVEDNPNVETENEETNKYCAILPLIAEIYADNEESQTFLFCHLGQEENKYGCRENSWCWNILADLIAKEESFRLYCDTIIHQCRENDTSKILRDGVKFIEEMGCEGLGENEFLKMVEEKKQNVLLRFLPQFAGIWFKIPLASKLAILNFLRSSVQQVGFLSRFIRGETVDGIIAGIGSLAKYGGTLTIILVLFPMGYQVLRSLYLWFTHQISGKRAIQNVVKTTSDTAICFGAAVGCATIGGMVAGPIGAVACGIAGALIAAKISKHFTKYLCKKIFNLPPTQALENAYKYLGIAYNAPYDEITEAYRRRILLDDPQQPGGSQKALCELQASYTIICVSHAEANLKVNLRNKIRF